MRTVVLLAAVLQVNSSLDLDRILRGVTDNARGLSGARHGVIITFGDNDCMLQD